MAQTHFTNLLIVVVVAFAAPFALGLAPRLRLPAVVLEIVAGIAIGPSGLGWVQIDEPVEILALIGSHSCCSSPASRSTCSDCAAAHCGSQASASWSRW